MAITMRPLRSYEECATCVEIQRQAWGGPDLHHTSPALMLATLHAGGIVSGAFTEAGELVGFVYSFAAQAEDGRFYHWSHQMAVLPEYAGRGIATGLKAHQRQLALDAGITLIRWTFDPLQGVNAHLNLNKLGAITNTYRRDAYGVMTGINAGLPSDRFDIDWPLTSGRVSRALAGKLPPLNLGGLLKAGADLLNSSRNGQPAGEIRASGGARLLLIEIPGDIARLKAEDMPLAQAWQAQVRAAFEQAFAAEYTALRYVRESKRGFYVLERNYIP